jgi:Uri superfamily endonuclease
MKIRPRARPQERDKQGAYILYLSLKQSLTIDAGSLGSITLSPGRYVYIGSARGCVAGRIARHRRLAENKVGKTHWHIDYLLVHPKINLIGDKAFANGDECALSKEMAAAKGVSIPVPRFGSSDCRSGCKAHFYRLSKKP